VYCFSNYLDIALHPQNDYYISVRPSGFDCVYPERDIQQPSTGRDAFHWRCVKHDILLQPTCVPTVQESATPVTDHLQEIAVPSMSVQIGETILEVLSPSPLLDQVLIPSVLVPTKSNGHTWSHGATRP